MLVVHNFGIERFFNRPIGKNEALIERAVRYLYQSGPLRHAERFTLICKYSILPRVFALFFFCSPATVVSRIAFVVVNSIKRMNRGGLNSNVTNKCIEAIPPFFTDSNTSSSISIVSRAPLVIAPLNHCRPCRVFAGTISSMGSFRGFRLFDHKAPARLSVPASKVISYDDCFIAARAKTEPLYLSVFGLRYGAYSEQPFEQNASNILCILPNCYIMIMIHLCIIAQIIQLTADIQG